MLSVYLRVFKVALKSEPRALVFFRSFSLKAPAQKAWSNQCEASAYKEIDGCDMTFV